jgi:CHAT domain-containing protein
MVNRTGWWAPRFAVILIAISVCSCSRQQSAEKTYQRAWSAFVAGDLPQAAEEAARGASQRQSDPNPFWHWKFRLFHAEVLTAQGKAKDAEALLKDSLPARSDLAQLEVRRLVDQAALKIARKNEAEDALSRARAAVRDPELALRIKLVEGLIALSQKQFDASQAAFRTAAALGAQQSNLYWQAQALSNLCYGTKVQRRYEESVEAGIQALALAEKAGARRIMALALGNLGSTYSYLGDFDAALEHEEKATRMLEVIGDRSNLMIGLGELGLMYDRQGETAKAIESYQRSYQLAKELGRNGDTARNAGNLALAFIRTKQWDAAADWNRRAAELAPANNRDAIPYLTRNEAEIADGRGRPEEAIRICEDLLRAKTLPPDLRWEVHALLGVIASDANRYQRAGREFEAALNIIDEMRTDLVNSHYRITLLSRLIRFYQHYVDALAEQNDDAAALRVVESSRARVLSERLGRDVKLDRSANLSGFRSLAASTRTTLLSFWLAPDRSFVWLINANGVRRFNLPPADEIEELVTAYREVVEHSLKDPIAAGDASARKLWDSLMAEAAPQIPKGSRVVVIPDGALHRLNLETLVAPSPQPHYWIEDVEVSVAPSLAIASSKPAPAAARNRSILLIGAPDYAGTSYEPLKSAPSELRGIQALFPDAAQAVYTGAQAIPAVYRQADPARFSFIHFAAHAEANREKPLESAVVLARQGGQYKLYARDVVEIPIQADLVTISACRSAGVRAYAGEGLIGFAWAFLQAGARAVVAGLWNVSDSSSEPLMNRFYAGLASGQSPASALRSAKLALAKSTPQYNKPFYWAPFQIYVGSAAVSSKPQ